MEDVIGRILARETVPELGEHLIGRRMLAHTMRLASLCARRRAGWTRRLPL